VIMLLLLLLTLCYCQDEPSPSTKKFPSNYTWPSTFHSWVVIEVTKSSPVNVTRVYNIGQHLVYSPEGQYSCRYLQQNLLVKDSPQRGVDFCDYKQGKHYRILDSTDSSVPCAAMVDLPATLPPLVWPAAFAADAQYRETTHVGAWYCDHFLNMNFPLGNQTIQMDVWIRNDSTQYPCQISITEVGSNFHTNWAFDGFGPEIPVGAQQCTAARVVCAENDYVCSARRNVTDTDIYGIGINAACKSPYRLFDCSPANPGGDFYKKGDILYTADWVFHAYFTKYKMDFGEQACDFYGAADLVQSSELGRSHRHMAETINKYSSKKSQTSKKAKNSENSVISYLKSFTDPIDDTIYGFPKDLLCVYTPEP